MYNSLQEVKARLFVGNRVDVSDPEPLKEKQRKYEANSYLYKRMSEDELDLNVQQEWADNRDTVET